MTERRQDTPVIEYIGGAYVLRRMRYDAIFLQHLIISRLRHALSSTLLSDFSYVSCRHRPTTKPYSPTATCEVVAVNLCCAPRGTRWRRSYLTGCIQPAFSRNGRSSELEATDDPAFTNQLNKPQSQASNVPGAARSQSLMSINHSVVPMSTQLHCHFMSAAPQSD